MEPGPLLPLLTSPGNRVDPKSRNRCRDIFGDFSALLKPKCFKANYLPQEKLSERENTWVLSQTRLSPCVQQRLHVVVNKNEWVSSPIQCLSKETTFNIV